MMILLMAEEGRKEEEGKKSCSPASKLSRSILSYVTLRSHDLDIPSIDLSSISLY
jgi:hypothetical protein